MFLDEKFKDSKPLKTVLQIQKLLSERGVSVEEGPLLCDVEHCYSLRVNITGTLVGQNGKGITPDLARASAYAEFMERYQSGYLYRGALDDRVEAYGDFKYAPDESIVTIPAYKSHNDPWMDACYRKILGEGYTEENVSALLLQLAEKNRAGLLSDIYLLPYENIETGDTSYFPQKLIDAVYFTNGTCAGNSRCEALVQGLSEILERASFMRIMKGEPRLPDIPDEYIDRWSECRRMMEEIQQKTGCTLRVKDASFGTGFPVVCVSCLFPEGRKGGLRLGAHPVFSIALERALTELLQGRSTADLSQAAPLAYSVAESSTYTNIHNCIKCSAGSYHVELFKPQPQLAFAEYQDASAFDNEKLYELTLKTFDSMGYDVYVRDMSYFGFNAYRVIVPGLSEIYLPAGTRLKDSASNDLAASVILSLPSATPGQWKRLKTYLAFKQNHLIENTLSYVCRRPALADAALDSASFWLLFAQCCLHEKDFGGAFHALNTALAQNPESRNIAAAIDAVRQTSQSMEESAVRKNLLLCFNAEEVSFALDFAYERHLEYYAEQFGDAENSAPAAALNNAMLARKKAMSAFYASRGK